MGAVSTSGIDPQMPAKSIFPLLLAQSSDSRSGCWSAAAPQIHSAQLLVAKT